MELWQRFTDDARRSILTAHDEARGMDAPIISAEHLLLGLVTTRDAAAAEVLEALGLDLEQFGNKLRGQIEIQPSGQATPDVSFTPEAQRVLQRAYAEARQPDDYHIGSEHILIGLLHESAGLARELLCADGAHLAAVTAKLAELGSSAA